MKTFILFLILAAALAFGQGCATYVPEGSVVYGPPVYVAPPPPVVIVDPWYRWGYWHHHWR